MKAALAPKLPDSLLEPASGEIACREWIDGEGARHVLVVAAIRPHSYVPRGPGGRGFGESKAAGSRYNAWRNTTREQLTVALKLARIRPFRQGEKLGLVVGGGMRPGPENAKRKLDVYGYDATNLTKAVEDLFTGLLYESDRGNRFVSSVWFDTGADWFSFAVWGEEPGGGLRLQADWMADEVWVGPTRADWLRAAT